MNRKLRASCRVGREKCDAFNKAWWTFWHTSKYPETGNVTVDVDEHHFCWSPKLINFPLSAHFRACTAHLSSFSFSGHFLALVYFSYIIYMLFDLYLDIFFSPPDLIWNALEIGACFFLCVFLLLFIHVYLTICNCQLGVCWSRWQLR